MRRSRTASNYLLRLAQFFPVVAITGPRQSGKTTLCRMLFPDRPYISFENPDVLWSAKEDPRGFLTQYSKGAIFDEAQRFPELFSYLQQMVDEDLTPGRFILTGSRQFELRSRISQSLAGRIGLLHLLPFTAQEWYNEEFPEINSVLVRGLYPPVLDRNIPEELWYSQYVSTYVERDVREILSIKDISSFSRFFKLCAGRVGQLINLTSLANDAGITHNTSKAWIDVLEGSYLLYRLQPWHENFGKRIIKSPKLYFTDTGLLCWLLGIRSTEQLQSHAMRGHIFENWTIMEALKQKRNEGLEPNLFFWRNQSGQEVDLLEVHGDLFHAIEIKAGQTLNKDYFKGLESFSELTGNRLQTKTLVYTGESKGSNQGMRVVNWRNWKNLL